MPTFEYKLITMQSPVLATLEGQLNELGLDHWEVIWVRYDDPFNTVILLKRQRRIRSFI